VVAQLAQLVSLAVGQLGVELFEPFAVVLFGIRPRQLSDTCEQTVLERERRCLDDESRGISYDCRPASLATFCSDSVINGFSDSTSWRASASSVGTTTASR
jgi:hypothetical protein